MSEPRRTGTAKVQILVEVETGTWGPECTLDQVIKQAREEATQRVRKIFRDATTPDSGLGTKRDDLHGVKLAAIVRVEVVLAEEPR